MSKPSASVVGSDDLAHPHSEGDSPTTEEESRAQADADREVVALIAEVEAARGTESVNDVRVADHLDMDGLTLAGDESSSASSSVAASVEASPLLAGEPTALAHSTTVPPVDLKDGGNAALESTAVKETPYDVRVAIVGNVDSGKSTLIGVLTGGQLDDGRGKARSKVFIHAHELSTGRTSAISQHIMGFDSAGHPVHQSVAASAQSAAKSKSWGAVVSASRSIVTFIDLAGHERYLSSTLTGLTGAHPDYAVVLVNSLAGVTKMTKEHLGVVLALEIPLLCVVTKVDLAPEPVLAASKKQLFRILKSSAANKTPIQMRTPADVETVIANSTASSKLCPVFFVSAVNGTHIDLLTSYLSRLRPHLEWMRHYSQQLGPSSGVGGGDAVADPSAAPCEFSIDEVFNVSGVGIVVSGTLAAGVMRANDTLLLGPFSDGSFVPVVVRSLHYKRVACGDVHAGQSCAASIRAVKRRETLKRHLIRRGMVLVDSAIHPAATRVFDAEVLVLHHPTTIKLGYQSVLHAGQVRQTAQICRIRPAQASSSCLRTGDKALCRFRLLLRAEYLHVGTPFVFREGSTKGIGKIVRVRFSEAELAEIEAEEAARKRQGGRTHHQGEETKEDGDNDKKDEGGGEAHAGAPKTSVPISTTATTGTSSAAPASSSTLAASSSSSSSKKTVSHASHGSVPSSRAATADEDAAAANSRQKWSPKEKQEYQKQKGEDKGGRGHK